MPTSDSIQRDLREYSMIAAALAEESDRRLERRLRRSAREERKMSIRVLIHLMEADRRRLHLKRGHGSLFRYCTEELGYSESAAGRRIRAARCLRDYPKALALLAAGELTICSLSAVAGILTRENHERVLCAIRRQSRRRIDEIVASYRPVSGVRERVRPVVVRGVVGSPALPGDRGNQGGPGNAARSVAGTADPAARPELFEGQRKNRPIPGRRRGGRGLADCVPSRTPAGRADGTSNGPAGAPAVAPDARGSEDSGAATNSARAATRKFKIEFPADGEFVAKMERVRALLSGRFPSGVSMEMLFSLLMDEYLERHAPEKKAKRREKRAKTARERRAKREAGPPPKRSRHIPNELRDRVFARDGGRCTWTSPDGKRCNSRWDLEIDHIEPFCRGGEHRLDNLRLLCANHNRLEAKKLSRSP